MSKSAIYIVCTLDEQYVQHCAVMLYSLIINNSKYSFNISIIKGKKYSTSFNNLVLFIRNLKQEINIIEINNAFFKKLPVSEHITPAAYFRLNLPQILSHLNKVLYLDPDIIIKEDIHKLWNIKYKHIICAAADPDGINRKIELNIPEKNIYFNSGVLLIDLQLWREKKISQKVFEYINLYPHKLKLWDQDALNAVLYNNYKLISNEWNLVNAFFKPDKNWEDEQAVNNLKQTAKIIHFTGSSKPWHLENKHPYKHLYYHYLKQTPWKNYSPFWDFIKRKSKKYLSFP